MGYLLLGLVLFLGAHSLPMHAGRRAALKQKLGEATYKALFSVVSLAGIVLIVVGYEIARKASPGILYDPPSWTRHLTMVLMLPVFILLFATYLPGRIKRAVKHPMILAVKIWAFAHLLANGDAASVLLFAAFLVWAVADRISLKRRQADLAGDAPAGNSRNDLAAIAGGLLTYGLFVWKLHEFLIGVPLVSG